MISLQTSKYHRNDLNTIRIEVVPNFSIPPREAYESLFCVHRSSTYIVGESHVRAVTNDLKSHGNILPHKKDVKQHNKYTYQKYDEIALRDFLSVHHSVNFVQCDGSILRPKYNNTPYGICIQQKRSVK